MCTAGGTCGARRGRGGGGEEPAAEGGAAAEAGAEKALAVAAETKALRKAARKAALKAARKAALSASAAAPPAPAPPAPPAPRPESAAGLRDEEEADDDDAYVGDMGGRVSGKKRMRMSVKGGVLGSVVSSGSRMTGTQIMTSLGASRSLAFKISKMAKRYPSAGRQVYEMPKVRSGKEVVATLAWLVDHMVDFPYKDMLTAFKKNGQLDVSESASASHRVRAAEARKDRAQDAWVKNLSYFDGRDGMNTLVAVLHSPLSVSTLVRAVQADATDLVTHVLVVRIGGVFLLLMTDGRPAKRFPVDWFMRIGDHTSAFMWLNVKDTCWDKFSSLTQAVEARRLRHLARDARDTEDARSRGEAPPAPEAGKTASRQKEATRVDSNVAGSNGKSSSVPVILPWTKLTQPTIAGMHLLSILFSRCEATPTIFSYVQPRAREGGAPSSSAAASAGPLGSAQEPHREAPQEAHERGGKAPSRKKRKAAAVQLSETAQWCLDVETFVKGFAVHKKRRTAPVPAPAPGGAVVAAETAAAAAEAAVATAALEEVEAPARAHGGAAEEPRVPGCATTQARSGGGGAQAAVSGVPVLDGGWEEALGTQGLAGLVGLPSHAVDGGRGGDASRGGHVPGASLCTGGGAGGSRQRGEQFQGPRQGQHRGQHQGWEQGWEHEPCDSHCGPGNSSQGYWEEQWQVEQRRLGGGEKRHHQLPPLPQTQQDQHYRQEQAETMAMLGLSYEDDMDDDPSRCAWMAPRQQRSPDKAEDWCEMDESAVKGYEVQWSVGESMGEFSGGSTTLVW